MRPWYGIALEIITVLLFAAASLGLVIAWLSSEVTTMRPWYEIAIEIIAALLFAAASLSLVIAWLSSYA